MLAADGSAAGDPAVAFAFDQAERRGVGLRVVHTVEVPKLPGASLFDLDQLAESVLAEDEKEVTDALAPHEARHPEVSVDLILVVGEPATTALSPDDRQAQPCTLENAIAHAGRSVGNMKTHASIKRWTRALQGRLHNHPGNSGRSAQAA